MTAYMAALGLADREAYDAQGNCFQPLALAVRIVDPLKDWRNGAPVPGVAIPSPAGQLRRSAGIRTAVKADLLARGTPERVRELVRQ
eukprot:1818342-Alexandrium_andersonii.AAC.1